MSTLRRRAGVVARIQTATTRTSRRGIATFSTPKNRHADSMPPKTSRRPASSNFHFPSEPAVLMLATEGQRLTHIESIEARYAQSGRTSCAAANLSSRRWIARPMPISSSAAKAKRSSPAIRGSAIGAATPSSRCADSASRPVDSKTRATFWSNGPAPFRKACCRIAFPIAANSRSSTPSTRRSGMSSPSTNTSAPPRIRPGLTDDCHTQKLRAAVEAILLGYSSGTRFGIRADDDGLLAAGEPGQQLTWMDARVDGRITPRIGKPVEIQALWINALWHRPAIFIALGALFEKGRARSRRFWNEHAGYLADVIDCDHQPGGTTSRFARTKSSPSADSRSLLVEGERAPRRRCRESCSRRSVSARSHPANRATRRTTKAASRNATVYHQGTVWPWLIGPFVEAWVRVRGNTPLPNEEGARPFPSAA